MTRVEYQAYLQSVEWYFLRKAVKTLSGGICEECQETLGAQVHHLTYERVGNERLEDLLYVCEECHRKLHGKTREEWYD